MDHSTQLMVAKALKLGVRQVTYEWRKADDGWPKLKH
jgi:hypothetical protein